MNRPAPRHKGVYQRCGPDCPADRCRKHRWSYSIELPAAADGQRRQVTKAGYETAAAAAAARAEVVRQHRAGELPANRALTVEQWLRRWLDAKTDPVLAEQPLRAGTEVSYRGHVDRYLIPRLGHIKLADLRPAHITAMFVDIRREREKARDEATAANNARAAEAAAWNAAHPDSRQRKPVRAGVPRPFGPTTATRVRATLSSALAAALEQGEVTRNVAAQTRQRKGRKHTRPRPKIWAPEQLGAFLDALEDAGERLYPLIHLCAFAGLRRGEACGLKWSAVDLDAATVTVDWQRSTAGYRIVEGKPKTDESESTVDIDADTVKVLRAWRKVQVAERLQWGAAWHDTGLVFTREDGTGYHPDGVSKRFTRLVARHGLPPSHLHALRHTAASLQLAAGVDIAIVSKRLRHSSIKLTADTYSHLIGKAGKDAAERARASVPRRRAV